MLQEKSIHLRQVDLISQSEYIIIHSMNGHVHPTMKGAVMEIRMKHNHQQTVTLISVGSQYIPTFGWVWIQRGPLDGSYLFYTTEEWEVIP